MTIDEFDGMTDSIIETCVSLAKEFPNEIDPAAVGTCPSCGSLIQRAESLRQLPEELEVGVRLLMPALPPRAHWVIRAMAYHIATCFHRQPS